MPGGPRRSGTTEAVAPSRHAGAGPPEHVICCDCREISVDLDGGPPSLTATLARAVFHPLRAELFLSCADPGRRVDLSSRRATLAFGQKVIAVLAPDFPDAAEV